MPCAPCPVSLVPWLVRRPVAGRTGFGRVRTGEVREESGVKRSRAILAQRDRAPANAGRGRTGLAGLAAAALLALAPSSGAVELSGHLAFEARTFMDPPAHPGQGRNGLSITLQPELYHAFGDGRQSLLFTPFLRADTADGRRTHFDVRELLYQRVFDAAELRIGIGRVFWGVTESRHLVDVINQTDLVENVDREDKLGQPLVNLTLVRDWGALDLFVLPGFRERTFPGRRGRLRSEPVVDAGRAGYESGAGRRRIDYALRWSHVIGDFDVGVAHFHGTSRDPRLLPVPAAGGPAPAATGEVVLAPRYDVVRRTSLDLQATRGAWLWKLEALHESSRGAAWIAWVAGFEYTRFGIGESAVDLGLLAEHLFDGRGGRAPQPFENDVFAGLRLAFNDEAGAEALAGIIRDAEGDATAVNVEASRRIGERWKVEIEARAWTGVDRGDPFFALRRDDYVQLTLSRFF